MKGIILSIVGLFVLFAVIRGARLMYYNEPHLDIYKEEDDIPTYEAKYKWHFNVQPGETYMIRRTISKETVREGLHLKIKRDTLEQNTWVKKDN